MVLCWQDRTDTSQAILASSMHLRSRKTLQDIPSPQSLTVPWPFLSRSPAEAGKQDHLLDPGSHRDHPSGKTGPSSHRLPVAQHEEEGLPHRQNRGRRPRWHIPPVEQVTCGWTDPKQESTLIQELSSKEAGDAQTRPLRLPWPLCPRQEALTTREGRSAPGPGPSTHLASGLR